MTALVGAGGVTAPEDDISRATAAAAALLAAAEDVTLLAHVRPDADALGSALALGTALYKRGTRVQVSFGFPDHVPETLRPLDVHRLCVPAAQVDAAPAVLVTCDVNEPARLGPLASRLATAGVTVMLDHHVTNPGFGDIRILDPRAEATVPSAPASRAPASSPGTPDLSDPQTIVSGLEVPSSGTESSLPPEALKQNLDTKK